MTEPASNRAAHAELLDDLHARLERAAEGGGEKARRRHLERGKLLVRQRVDVLLDPGSPFLELSALAAEEMYEGRAPAAGLVTGIGRVSGRECVIVANDARSRPTTGSPASTSSTPAARCCCSRTTSFPTASISGGSSTTRPR